MEFWGLFWKFWSWVLAFFGKSKNSYPASSNGRFHLNVSEPLSLLSMKNITSNLDIFKANYSGFFEDMKSRHGANDVLNWHLMSGAAVYIPESNKNILFERLFYSLQDKKGHRTAIEKSFIIMTPWNGNWTAQIGRSEFVNANETFHSVYFDDIPGEWRDVEGPEDARVIYDEKARMIRLNFNMLTPREDRQMFGLSVKIDESNKISANRTEKLVQYKHPGDIRLGFEKNWIPIIVNNEQHYVYSLEPLRILKCAPLINTDGFPRNEHEDVTARKAECYVAFDGPEVDDGSQTGALRGGTNWVEYSQGVYFSIARTRLLHDICPFAIYRPHLIILKFETGKDGQTLHSPKLIYASEPIVKFDDVLFNLYKKLHTPLGNKCDDLAVLTPGSISKWTGMLEGDVADVVISVNDDVNVVMQLQGLGQAVESVLTDSHVFRKKYNNPDKSFASKAEDDMINYLENVFAFLPEQDNEDGSRETK